MVRPRANWKGVLKIDQVTCPVALFTAASQSERVAFHTLNRESGQRVRREYVDAETEKPVKSEDQVKGYEKANGDYVILEPEEIAAAIPESDKTLTIEAFVGCSDIDEIYFDRPYYLAPADPVADESFAVLRDGMRKMNAAALARAVLFRRMRTVLVRPHGDGMIATTLNFDYEVRSSRDAFSDVPKAKIKGEMLELAVHIIATKKGVFDPKKFDDRYENALAELVKAKLEGRKIAAPKAVAPTKPSDLMEALRLSAGTDKAQAKPASKKPAHKPAARKPAASKTAKAPMHRKAS